LGVCRPAEIPTYKTKVYTCDNQGNATYLKDVSYGDKYFSIDQSKNAYIKTDGSVVFYTSASQACQVQNIEGSKQIGDNCNNDLECSTKHCDKTHWYSLTNTCQPIPWDELKKVAVSKEELKDMTTGDKMAILCTSDSQCIVRDTENKANCIPLSVLREEGLIIESKNDFWDYANKFFYGTGGGAIIGGALGGGICVGAGVVMGFVFPPSIPAIISAGPTICSITTLAGGAIGAYEGTKLAFKLDEKSDLTKYIKAKDDNSAGLCVIEEKGGDFFKQFAFFDIDGNGVKDKTDGMIIFFGGIVLILFLLTMFGGKK
jgi:hypothetical protein